MLDNQDRQPVTLSSYQNKSPIVLFFYPKAGTPGCTAEACAFRDAFTRFEKAGVKARCHTLWLLLCQTATHCALIVGCCSSCLQCVQRL